MIPRVGGAVVVKEPAHLRVQVEVFWSQAAESAMRHGLEHV
ncbi:hypothetical protein [Deinococcus ruber]|nr:hypothetical protein [Deinococcus ruber]